MLGETPCHRPEIVAEFSEENLGAEITMRTPKRGAAGAGAVPDKPSIEPLLAVVEFAASCRREVLPWLLTVTDKSTAHFNLLQLADDWGVEMPDLQPVALKAARDLDRLEAVRATWTDPGSVLREPHVVAVLDLAVQRLKRARRSRRQRHLEAIIKRLEIAAEAARQNRWIHEFIGRRPEKATPPAEKHWVERLFGDEISSR